MTTPTFFVLDHTEIRPTKGGKARTYIACNVYRIGEIRPSISQALTDFLKPWDDSQNRPSLTAMVLPEYRAYLFYGLTKTILSHVDFALDHEFGKVQVDNTSIALSKFLQAQNNRRERATTLHPNSYSPLRLPYFLKLPQPLTQAFLRLATAQVYHVTLPTSDINDVLTPVAVYSYDPKQLHEHFNYTNLVDWQVFSKPSDFRATKRFRQMFDPDRSNRLRSSQELETMVFNRHWLQDYAHTHDMEAHQQLVVDHDLHVQEVAEELLLIYKEYQMPMHRRIGWDEIDQRAAELYPDFRRNPDVYKVSEPKFIHDVWGTAYAIKIKVLLYPHTNPSPLPDVRTNKDGAITSLRGLKSLFNLIDIQGDFVFAMKVSLVPKDKVADEVTQTLIQRPKRAKGRPKVLKDNPHRPRPTPKPRVHNKKEEADTTPI